MAAGSIAVPSRKFDEFAQSLIESGRYNSPSEVLDAAVDALMREGCDDAAKQVWLKEALDAGFSSGVAEGDVIGRIRARHGLPMGTA